jgi:CRISPR-associated protein Cmr2
MYAGSYLLSHLTKTGISALKNLQASAEIVFPNETIESMPNRFLAIVEGEKEKFRRLGEQVKEAIIQEWHNIAEHLMKKMEKEGVKRPKNFGRQIGYYLDISWIVHPMNGSYEEEYPKVERHLGEVKGVRPFFQLEEQGRKCILTGEHDALFYRGVKRAYMDEAVEVPVRGELGLRYLSEGEAIGAVGMIKRFAGLYFTDKAVKDTVVPFEADFPSTAHIALLDALYQVKEGEEANIEPKAVDAAFVLSVLRGGEFSEEITEEVEKNSRKVVSLIQDMGISTTPYYAVIVFDGDNMGKWLSGEKLRDQSQLQDFHTHISLQLGAFAKKARAILTGERGVVVYAGGDDFLGLVHVRHLFPVMKELREAFEAIDVSDFTEETMAFSAGVVIAHYKEPLSLVLNKAREMEKLAKKKNDKDSFGICLLKHSGEQLQSVLKWTFDEHWTTDLADAIVDSLRKHFSDTFIRVFQTEVMKLADHAEEIETKEISTLDEMLKAEWTRLMYRACSLKKDEKAEAVEELQKKFTLLQELIRYSAMADTHQWSTFFSFLNILLFLEREVKSIA